MNMSTKTRAAKLVKRIELILALSELFVSIELLVRNARKAK